MRLTVTYAEGKGRPLPLWSPAGIMVRWSCFGSLRPLSAPSWWRPRTGHLQTGTSRRRRCSPLWPRGLWWQPGAHGQPGCGRPRRASWSPTCQPPPDLVAGPFDVTFATVADPETGQRSRERLVLQTNRGRVKVRAAEGDTHDHTDSLHWAGTRLIAMRTSTGHHREHRLLHGGQRGHALGEAHMGRVSLSGQRGRPRLRRFLP